MWVIILFKRFATFLLVLAFALSFTNYSAYSKTPELSAESAIVIDLSTISVLYEKNAYLERPMASTTKIMTCVIACESGKLNDTVKITREMLYNTEGTSLYLKEGDTITLNDLVIGAMLASGNDCANAIAFYLSGGIENFCALMNEKAKELGMTQTYFATPSGLDMNNHHSSAYDMALLASYAMRNETFVKIAGMTSCSITVSGVKKTVNNHNKLLKLSENFTGVKTGFTKKAGRCLISAYKYSDNTIITVTLNAPDDWNDHIKLVEYAKSKYSKYEDKGALYIDCVGAEKQEVKCGYSYSVYTLEKPWVKLCYYPFLYAPVKAGDTVGYAEIMSTNSKLMRVEIKAQEDINYGK